MRVAVYVGLLALALAAVALGEPRIGLAIAGAKTLLVGVEYMELRSAALPHLVGFTLAITALVLLLVALA